MNNDVEISLRMNNSELHNVKLPLGAKVPSDAGVLGLPTVPKHKDTNTLKGGVLQQ
jgi:hypothetical protein